MNKIIDLAKSIYEICNEHPEVIDIMKGLGFEQISTPGMLQTAGRFMTIPKGAAMKNIPMDKVVEALHSNGYQINE